nr:chemotaxis protein CheA [Bacteroidota bacterium]
MDPFKAKFIEEATDLLAELEKSLLEIEARPDDPKLIENCFRVMHTLKGSSAMFGYEQLGGLTHDLETIYVLIREGKATITKEILDVTLNSVDHFKDILSSDTMDENGKVHDALAKQINSIVSKISGTETAHISKSLISGAEVSNKIFTYYILFRPKATFLRNGSNPLYLIEDLHSLGECKITAHIKDIPEISDIQPENCYVYWDIYLVTKEPIQTIKDIFMFVEDDCALEVHQVAEGNLLTHSKFLNKIDGIDGNISVSELKEFIQNLLQIIKKQEGNEDKVSAKESNAASLRVSTEKLDNLMNMVSELVTTQARLSLFAEKNANPELINIVENVEKIVRQLRDNAFSICLIPIENLLMRFKRLVRDLSAELKKDINFITEGDDTELDKNIIEHLGDPILHIIRNSLDHGIETPEERIAKGKPAQGTIFLKTFYSGNNVHILIKDDGAGIDPEKVKNKAIQKGLINVDTELSKKEIFDLIFLPGFSTTEKVTEVSGRGVGMDVVRRKINELRGLIEMDSSPNVGTSITIKLPLTFSIIDGLLVRID